MTPGLRQHALARIDQQHAEIAIGRAGRHVARVLHMARRIGDDEFPPRRGEIAIGHVDGDALLALGLEAVDKEGQIDLAALRGVGTLGVALDA